jgi:hypothetical protein
VRTIRKFGYLFLLSKSEVEEEKNKEYIVKYIKFITDSGV